jgi:Asp/Glu/hydantoin racemase
VAGPTVGGVTLGILMLETRFRRFVGDIGNAETWPFPVVYKVVRGATPTNIIRVHDGALLPVFIRAAQELADEGVDGITTTCGFLAFFQAALARACPVPVATSALLQAPMVARTLPRGRRVGILTYDAAALTAPYLEAVGVDPATPVLGLPKGTEFHRAIVEGDTSVPYDVQEREVLAAAAALMDLGDIGAIVCECTNLTPFSATMAERFGVPVFDAVGLVHWFYQGLRPRVFPRR